jgi:thymidylate synthase
MTISILANNTPEAYVESYWTIKTWAKPEQSRAGPVLSIPQPVVLEIRRPYERVLFDVERNANPFFHVMETIWMLAGGNRVGFPARFNSTYVNYAEADGVVHGAYGKRWRDHWKVPGTNGRYSLDQIQLAIAFLKEDPSSRQVVLSMWDPPEDLGAKVRDRPCNTHIYFRAHEGVSDRQLDMTVCNRSNDLLWGMLGANIVHMTYLHELVAHGAGMEMGTYRVFTNNLHVYTETDVYQNFSKGPVRQDPYHSIDTYPLLNGKETVENLLQDCEDFIDEKKPVANTVYRTKWINEVAAPMYMAYRVRICKTGDGLDYVEKIQAEDWRLACRQWIERKIR